PVAEALRIGTALLIAGRYLFSDEYALPAVAGIFIGALVSLIALAICHSLDRGWRLPVGVRGW
ncbi:MAG: hypothetical protein ACOCZ8_02750, partial [Bacteroidota bacterium]